MKLKNLGEKLNLLRTNNNLFQREIGDILNVSKSQVCRYEKNVDSISDYKLYKLLDILSVEKSYFIKEER